MWTPLLLPDVYQTNGTNFGGWWDPAYSATVTLNSGKVASISNLFSGGPAQSQATSALQPTYTTDYIDFPTANQAAGYGLLSASAILRAYFCAVLRYGDGTPTTFTGYDHIYSDSANSVSCIVGDIGTRQLYSFANTGTAYQNDTGSGVDAAAILRNTCEYTERPLPLPLSLVEAQMIPRSAVAVGPYTSQANQNWRGPYREFMFLAANPTAEMQARIQGYMMWHNGIQASLPPEHPYAAAPPRVS
jgi:hypothetical protein